MCATLARIEASDVVLRGGLKHRRHAVLATGSTRSISSRSPDVEAWTAEAEYLSWSASRASGVSTALTR